MQSVIGDEDREVGVHRSTEDLSTILTYLEEVTIYSLKLEYDIICFMLWKIVVIFVKRRECRVASIETVKQ